MESRKIKNGTMSENERTISQHDLNSLEAEFGELPEPQPSSPVKPSKPNTQPQYNVKTPTTASSFEEKQQLSKSRHCQSDEEDEEEEQSDSQSQEEEYQAEDIVAVMLNEAGDKVENHFIKWEDYPPSQNTWEPPKHVSEDLKPQAKKYSKMVDQV